MWQFIHKWGSPKYFYTFAGRCIPWLAILTVILFAYGLVGGLILAPADYQQGNAFRIIYVHVPSAFMSLAVYSFMTVCAIVGFVWKMKLSDVMIKVSAPIGAWFTFLALFTGAMWGKPMWGAYWVWDARLTSELILLFIYFGIIALRQAIDDVNVAARAVGLLTIVGFVNIPIIHYSVYWWNTLHQGDSIKFIGQSTIAPSMLQPLIVMTFAFMLYFVLLLLMRARSEVLKRERKSSWISEVVQ